MMIWPPMNAVIPPTAKEIEAMLRRRDINRLKVAGILAGFVLLVSCANKLDTPSLGPQLATASATTATVSTDIKDKSSDISTNADHAYTIAPQVKRFTDPIKADTTALIGDAGKLDQVTVELASVKDQSAAKDKQLADAISQRDAALANENSGWHKLLYSLIGIGTVGLIGAGVLLWIGNVKTATIVAVASAGTIGAAYLVLNFAVWIMLACIAVAVAGVAYLLITKTNANAELVHGGEVIKDELASLGTVGVAKIKSLFGSGTTPGKLDSIQSASTKKIVAKHRGKDYSAVRLAAPIISVAPPAAATLTA